MLNWIFYLCLLNTLSNVALSSMFEKVTKIYESLQQKNNCNNLVIASDQLHENSLISNITSNWDHSIYQVGQSSIWVYSKGVRNLSMKFPIDTRINIEHA